MAYLLLAAIIRGYVTAKAKPLGYKKIPGSFTAYSLSVFAKAFMIFSIVFIPHVFRIAGCITKKNSEIHQIYYAGVRSANFVYTMRFH